MSNTWQWIIGFGSLLSEKSAKSTMPNLRNFQLAKLKGYKRVFAHPANIFIKKGIGTIKRKDIGSLSVEQDLSSTNSFIVSVFQIPKTELNSFYLREDEYAFKEETVELISSLQLINELLNIFDDNPDNQYQYKSESIKGILCVKSTDKDYIKRWGQNKFDKEWKSVGINSIWNWNGEIYPCAVYLRHCLLSIKKQGQFALDDFMKNTYLYDRKTTIKEYMKQNPHIYNVKVPLSLKYRYNG